MIYALCLVLFMIGLYGVVAKKNLVKIVMGLMIMEYAVNLLLVLMGYKQGGQAPVVKPESGITMVDPLPQAMVLTTLVIGLGMVFLVVAICIRIYDRYGTFDITEIRRLRG